MTSLRPWAGLALIAARFDLSTIIQSLGGPVHAAAASAQAWLRAGLPFEALCHLESAGVDAGGLALTPADPRWPVALEGQPHAPVLLGAEGNVELLKRPGVAVVGARGCTPYGLEHARAISSAISEAGGVVVSGLARGIDREAHLSAPGATIGVLGQGLDSPMPVWQASVRQRILAGGGLVLSEFPRLMPADRWTFPVRNRIVAGLARITVVVEASHQSGAKNTAGHALRLGKDVLALPGPVNAPASAGCLDLLEDGAGLVRNPGTVLDAAGLRRPTPARAAPVGREEQVFAALGSGGSTEQLVARAGLPYADVCAALVVLGLTGRVSRLPGNRYVPRGPP